VTFWPRYRAGWRDELCLLAPSLAVLALVSSQTGFAGHSRYALPCLPFWFIWMSKLARAPALGDRALAAVAAVLLAWTTWAGAAYYPHGLSYFNELVGGPLGGRHQLAQSDLDWGQDLLYLRDWLGRHPEAKPLRLAYYGSIDPRYAGIEFTPPPGRPHTKSSRASSELPVAGSYAISVTRLQGVGRSQSVPDGKGGSVPTDSTDFTWLGQFTPVAIAGYSIYIYHLSEADARRGLDAPRRRSR
jgi:hypothetical protein